MAANEQLAVILREAGFLRSDGSGRKAFARAVGAQARRTFSHTYVTRWLDGVGPRDLKTQRAIAAAIGDRLGRKVDLDECGFGVSEKVSVDLGLNYPEKPADGITVAARLWQADLDSVNTLLMIPANVASWNEAALSWLVGSAQAVSSTTGPKVGASDIDGIRSTTDMFDQIDGRHGGGHARRSLIEFLRTTVASCLRGSYTDEVGRELFKVSAQSTLLGAWMSYDAGLHGLAQRYFIHALKFAETTGDRLLGAGILDAMSHQATFTGNYREAANLASAARMGTTNVGSASSQAHFFAMEARALARLGDAAGCDTAMANAVREFERRRPEDDPADWFSYFDEAELAAELGHCNRDLGRAVDASTYANQSLGGGSGGYVRSDFFVTMVLADSYLDQGESEEACRVALTGLEIGEQLKSARCRAYVDEFRARLSRVDNSQVVRDFVEQASATRLWTPDDARTAPNRGGSR